MSYFLKKSILDKKPEFFPIGASIKAALERSKLNLFDNLSFKKFAPILLKLSSNNTSTLKL